MDNPPMGMESLGSVFYVSAKGDIYLPIPRDHSLVPDITHRDRPGLYNVVLLENAKALLRHKDYVLRHFFAKSDIESFGLGFDLERYGRVSAGPFTREVAETRMGEIRQDGRDIGYRFDLILEKA